MRKIIKAVAKILACMDTAWRNHIAEYVVLDSLGTRQLCFTVSEALEWLPYCAPEACIVNRATGLVEVSRRQQYA